MKKSQLNAIAYAYAEKKRRENREQLVGLGLVPVFNMQKEYKTITWFLKARENCWKKYEKIINDIREKMELECRYEKWSFENACGRVEKNKHSISSKLCALVVAACERELDRILNHAVIQHCGGAADGN